MVDRSKYLRKIKNHPGFTPFQKKVLLAVMEIPRGKARSYAWVARKVGSPEAARAVGTALSANPYAPMVPCHRVISSDGSAGGYSGPGGAMTKVKLLKLEGAWRMVRGAKRKV